jgi:hypothetical protein
MMGWMAPLRHLSAMLLAVRESAANGEPSMGEVTTIGLDFAKHASGARRRRGRATVLRTSLRRAQVLTFFSRLPPCLVGLEACATAHSVIAQTLYWETTSSSCPPSAFTISALL